ncbi:hypothetical protein [Spiroplasma endosymbiont of Diplazon laetatorius]|uniref:hypothetical protein n=1 Tax=Spiroplasma endosymbiont of Diplazon laetatorius TaxID=3066322 RepID=UPI0030D31DE1
MIKFLISAMVGMLPIPNALPTFLNIKIIESNNEEINPSNVFYLDVQSYPDRLIRTVNQQNDKINYEFKFTNDESDVIKNAYANSLLELNAENYFLFRAPLTYSQYNEVKTATNQKMKYSTPEKERTAIEWSTNDHTDVRPSLTQKYTYYHTIINSTVSSMEQIKNFTNPVISQSIYDSGFELKAGTVMENLWTIGKGASICFIFYLRAYVPQGGANQAFLSNVNWNIGHSIELTTQ